MTIASQDKDYKDDIDFKEAGAESPAMNTAVLAPHAKGLPGKSPADLPPTSSSRLPAILCLLVSPRLSAALWCTLLQAAMMTSFDAVLPLQVHEAFGWSSTGAGLIFLPLLLPCFTGPIIGAASDGYGARWPAVVDFLFGCPGFICLRFVTQNTLRQKALLCTLLVIDGLGINLAMIPLFAEFAHVIDA
ncbi:hypothetical protein OEA41_002638 [Lepraria neglecta]|uniref:Major facilitator superfamily (MFS) profile domain-containing protein n=1 Tax=Lepraria neglecta TaxID=209136 RepID=A0AAD9Z685_9LECA|nr:hypothetical protein OEA41_002638 [Lepraria neglecta]